MSFCCRNGFFAHAFVLCFGTGCATGENVCECTVPCLSYMSGPGVEYRQCCIYSTTKYISPIPDISVNFWWQCNLCLCGFDIGDYSDVPKSLPHEPSVVMAPVTQSISRNEHESRPENE